MKIQEILGSPRTSFVVPSLPTGGGPRDSFRTGPPMAHGPRPGGESWGVLGTTKEVLGNYEGSPRNS